jgi:hypothetical protein
MRAEWQKDKNESVVVRKRKAAARYDENVRKKQKTQPNGIMQKPFCAPRW